DDVLAVVHDVGEVLDRGQPRFRVRQRAGRCPAVRRGQRAGAGRRWGGAPVDPDQLPLLVGAVPVAVLHHAGAVGGRGALHVGDLAAVPVDQPDITVAGVGEAELLVGAAVVGPLHHGRAVGGGLAVDVEEPAGVAGAH